MSENTIYAELSNPVMSASDAFNELKISVDYCKGGENYFTGRMNRRGIYVHLKPVKRNGICESCMITGDMRGNGFKVFVKELGRKSSKQEAAIFAKVAPLAENIAGKYDACDFSGISADILTAIAG